MPEELKRKLAKPSNSNAHHRPLPELSQVKDEDDDDFDVEEEDEEEDEDDAEEEENDDENTRLTPKASLIDDNRWRPIWGSQSEKFLLFHYFRFLWKCRYTYHFIHDSHVKGKDERKPTVNDLANQKDILQKLDGWKVEKKESISIVKWIEFSFLWTDSLPHGTVVWHYWRGERSDPEFGRLSEEAW